MVWEKVLHQRLTNASITDNHQLVDIRHEVEWIWKKQEPQQQ